MKRKILYAFFTAVLSATAPAQQQPRDLDRLVSEWWELDKSHAQEVDGKIGVKNEKAPDEELTVLGTPSWGSSSFGDSMRFDGQSCLVIQNAHPLPDNETGTSFEVFFAPDEEMTDKQNLKDRVIAIFDKGFRYGGCALTIRDGCYCMMARKWTTFFGPPVDTEPEHIIVTFDRQKVLFYANGDLFKEYPVPEIKPAEGEQPTALLGPLEARQTFIIGGWEAWADNEKGYQPTPGFKGWIRFVKIYDVTLTEKEVAALFHASSKSKP